MKPTKIFRILTPLILALFILSLFSGTVAAQQTAREQYEKTKEQYQIQKEKLRQYKKAIRRCKKAL